MRLIVMKDEDAFTQMAVDEVILDEVIEDSSTETVRFYSFEPPAITIGKLQSIDDIDVDYCRANSIDVVRRLTGGRAVVHSNDFTFSFILKKDNHFFQDKGRGTIYETYRAVSKIFLSALLNLGFPAKWERYRYNNLGKGEGKNHRNPLCFSSTTRYELTVGARKILGIAQYRKKNSILVQGSLVLRNPDSKFLRILSSGLSLDNALLLDNTIDVSFDEFGEVLKSEIRRTSCISLENGKMCNKELGKISAVKRKYASLAWNHPGG